MRLRAISILASIASIFACSSYYLSLRFLSSAVFGSSVTLDALFAVERVLALSKGFFFCRVAEAGSAAGVFLKV